MHAQYTDIVGWTDASIKFDLTKDLEGSVGQQLRYDFTIGSLYQWNSEASLDYKLIKHLKAGVDYRFSYRPGGSKQRVGLGLTYKDGFGDFDLGFRSKIQYSFTPDNREGSTWRNKISGDYKINKHWYVGASGEIFYAFSNTGNLFNNYRLGCSVEHRINKHNSLELAYLYDDEFHVNAPVDLHVMSLSYAYSF